MLGIANSFSGGVFLAIAFVHILPETANLYYYSKLEKLLDHQRQAKSDEFYGGESIVGPENRLVTEAEIE